MKIDATNGTSYTYYFADGSKCILKAGEDEVTEEMICALKRADNREYDRNLKNWGPEPTKEQKEQWRQKHPDEDYPRLWNASLDYGGNGDEIEKSLYRLMRESAPSDEYALLYEAIELLPPKQKQLVELLLEGYSQSEIARMQSLSTSTVRDQFNGAKKNIKKNFD